MIHQFASDRIHQMTKCPEMWGGHEAVELQVLLLLEVCAAELAAPRKPTPRAVLDAYIRFADAVMGDEKNIPLSARMREVGRQAEFPAVLERFATGMWTANDLDRLHQAEGLLFGIDYDGTLAADPVLFGWLICSIRMRGHEVLLVTGRSDEGKWGDEVRAALSDIGINVPIVFAANGWKRLAAEAAGYKVDIWVDDHPEWIGPQDPEKIGARPQRPMQNG